MPAGLPGDSLANNLANPTVGRPILMDPLSGPKGSPLDKGSAGTASTGALSTGIGIGANSIFNAIGGSAPVGIYAAGFNDNMVPGEKVTAYAAAPPPGVVTTDVADSTRMYIGGGRTITNPTVADRPSVPFTANPYTAGRDGGAGPAFTGFALKMVTATGAVANGAAVETGFINRSNVALVATQSVFGSDAAQLAVAS
jgi:hypothetical protein